MDTTRPIDRRSLLRRGAALSAAVTLGPLHAATDAAQSGVGKTKVGVIGCGSVSRPYLSHLARSPLVELVSVCDILPERARQAADRHRIPHHYPHVDQMLAGAHFDLFINLTDMQEHERLNEQALEAGRHVWSEKPIANSLTGGQRLLELARKQGARLWGAPTVVQSPQFAFMAKQLAEGKLGRVAAARGDYGHEGPRMGRRSSTRNWAVRCRTSRFTISRRSRACSAR